MARRFRRERRGSASAARHHAERSQSEILVDERDGKGLGDDSTAKYKQIYRIDILGAADVNADLPGYVAQQLSVPEPATWMTMLAGFGLLGTALRRAKRKTAVRFA